MPRFTFMERPEYIPVAKVVSQDNLNGEILFLDPSINSANETFNYEKQAVNYNKYMKNISAKDMNKKSAVISKYLAKNKEPEDDELKSIYKSIMKDGSKDVILKQGTFIPIPDIHRERIHITFLVQVVAVKVILQHLY